MDESEPDTNITEAKRRRLKVLQEQAARYGLECPPHIILEIEDLQQELGQHDNPGLTIAVRASTKQKIAGRSIPLSYITTTILALIITALVVYLVSPSIKPSGAQSPTDTALMSAATTTSPATQIATDNSMVLISAGPFLMGNNSGAANEQPEHTVYLNDYWIDIYEVTNAHYQKFIEQTNHRPPDHWQHTDYPAGLGNHPVEGVTWYDAKQYCEWQGGKRLPSEAEWEKAARGTENRTWPWGKTWANAYANTHEAGIDHTEAVGTYVKDKSQYGVMDMAGNVSEWVNDWYQADYYADAVSDNPPGPISGTNKVVRGGTYSFGQNQAKTFVRLGIYPPEYPFPLSEHIPSPSSTTGFRCACTNCK